MTAINVAVPYTFTFAQGGPQPIEDTATIYYFLRAGETQSPLGQVSIDPGQYEYISLFTSPDGPAGASLQTPTPGYYYIATDTAGDTTDSLTTGANVPQPTIGPSIVTSAETTPYQTSEPSPTASEAVNDGSQPSSTPGPANTGLKAAVGVLAGLLVISLVVGCLIFLRGRKRQRQVSTLDRHGPDTEPPSEAKSFLKTASVKALAVGPDDLPSSLDDKTIHSRFAQLDSSLQDWVASSFRSASRKSPEMIESQVSTTLDKIGHEWKALLAGDQRSQYLLVRGLVGAMLCEAWASGELVGSRDVVTVTSKVSGGRPTPTTVLWRAQTFLLLASNSSHTTVRAAAIDRLANAIDASCTSILVPLASDSSSALGGSGRLTRLRALVQTASDLALELGQQKVLYVWGSPINAENANVVHAKEMEDVLQEQRANKFDGKKVRVVVFPGVGRWGDEDGGVGSWEKGMVVRRAQVHI